MHRCGFHMGMVKGGYDVHEAFQYVMSKAVSNIVKSSPVVLPVRKDSAEPCNCAG